MNPFTGVFQSWTTGAQSTTSREPGVSLTTNLSLASRPLLLLLLPHTLDQTIGDPEHPATQFGYYGSASTADSWRTYGQQTATFAADPQMPTYTGASQYPNLGHSMNVDSFGCIAPDGFGSNLLLGCNQCGHLSMLVPCTMNSLVLPEAPTSPRSQQQQQQQKTRDLSFQAVHVQNVPPQTRARTTPTQAVPSMFQRPLNNASEVAQMMQAFGNSNLMTSNISQDRGEEDFQCGRPLLLRANMLIYYGRVLQDLFVLTDSVLVNKMIHPDNNQEMDEVINFLQHYLLPQEFDFMSQKNRELTFLQEVSMRRRRRKDGDSNLNHGKNLAAAPSAKPRAEQEAAGGDVQSLQRKALSRNSSTELQARTIHAALNKGGGGIIGSTCGKYHQDVNTCPNNSFALNYICC